VNTRRAAHERLHRASGRAPRQVPAAASPCTAAPVRAAPAAWPAWAAAARNRLPPSPTRRPGSLTTSSGPPEVAKRALVAVIGEPESCPTDRQQPAPARRAGERRGRRGVFTAGDHAGGSPRGLAPERRLLEWLMRQRARCRPPVETQLGTQEWHNVRRYPSCPCVGR
jgi:hypothetical protein